MVTNNIKPEYMNAHWDVALSKPIMSSLSAS